MSSKFSLSKMKAVTKKAPSRNILARALGKKLPQSMKEKVAAPRGILERVFNKQSGLEQASHEGMNRWFKQVVEDQFKRWHKHADGSPAKPIVMGSYGEDLEKSESGLERAVAKTASTGEPPIAYVGKGGPVAKDEAGGKKEDIKDAYKAGASGASYKAGGDAHASGTSYQSQAAGAVVSCASCGTGAHASLSADGSVSFNSMGKMGGNMYQVGGGNNLYGAGGQNASYQASNNNYSTAQGGNVQSTNYQQSGGDED